jgi:hypothetical protein
MSELPTKSIPSLRFKLGTQTFESLNEVKKFVNGVIQSHMPGTYISDQNTEAILLDLLRFHPKASDKLDGFSRILVNVHVAGEKKTKCLQIEKNTGARDEISYIKSANAMAQTEMKARGYMNVVLSIGSELAKQLGAFLSASPMLIPRAQLLITETFPDKTADVDIQRFFVRNLLQLTKHLPRIGNFVLTSIVEKLVCLDINMDTCTEIDKIMALVLEHINSEDLETMFEAFLQIFE